MTIEPPEPAPDPLSALHAGVRQFAASADEKAGNDALIAGNRQYLAALSDKEFAQLVAEVRPPADTTPDDGPVYPASWGFKPTPTN